LESGSVEFRFNVDVEAVSAGHHPAARLGANASA